MTRFAGLKDDLPIPERVRENAVLLEPSAPAAKTPRSRAREGKKGILGHFSPELSRTLNIMAIKENKSVQALMGEAFDLLMRSRGEHPFGER